MRKTLSLIFVWSLLFSFPLSCTRGEEKKEVYDVTREKGALVQGNTRSGERGLLDLLAREPNNFGALVELGNFYFDNHQFRKSVEMYQRALKINPRDANVRTDMGVMLRELREYDRAAREFRQAAADNLMHEQSRVNLGITLYYDLKDARGAIEAWESALKINPNYADAARVRGMIAEAKETLKGGVMPAVKQKTQDGWIK